MRHNMSWESKIESAKYLFFRLFCMLPVVVNVKRDVLKYDKRCKGNDRHISMKVSDKRVFRQDDKQKSGAEL